jgi:hypothetical protein
MSVQTTTLTGVTESNVIIDNNFKRYLADKIGSGLNTNFVLELLRKAFLPSPTILTKDSSPIITKYKEPQEAINIEISRAKYFVPKTEFDDNANNGKGAKVPVKDDDGNILYKLVDDDELDLEATGENEAKKAEEDPDADVDPAGKMEMQSIFQKQIREKLFEDQLKGLADGLSNKISIIVSEAIVEALKGIQINAIIDTNIDDSGLKSKTTFDQNVSSLLGISSSEGTITGKIKGTITPNQFTVLFKTPQ